MLNVQWVPIGTLKLNPRNARTHQNKQVKQIADSINAFGWTAPIVLDENSMILAGHGRYLAATRLGQKNAPVIVKIGLSDTQKRALAIADNKIASNADWDRAQLAAELGELATLLPECNLDLQITGFEAAEIDSFMVDHVDPEQDPTDEIPPLKAVAVSQRGDCWRLGHHRLYCGDSRNEDHLRALLDGASRPRQPHPRRAGRTTRCRRDPHQQTPDYHAGSLQQDAHVCDGHARRQNVLFDPICGG